MEEKKIKRVLTALGNPKINNELKKIDELEIVNNDIFYQEGIFEILELEKQIDFIILNQFLPGELEICEFIEEIIEFNSKIKIILILKEYNENLEKSLLKNGVYRILFNENYEDILKIINENYKIEKYNEEIKKEILKLEEDIKNSSQIEKQKNKINFKFGKNNKINILKNKIIRNNLTKNKIIKSNLTKNKIIDNKSIKNNKIINFNKINENSGKKITNKNINKKIDFIINILNNKFLYFKKINGKYIIKNKINEKNKNNKNNKIISILGNGGAGKSIFSVLLASGLKKYYSKILVIDFDILNNSIHTIFGVNKYSLEIKKMITENTFEKNKINIENLIIKIDSKIDLISGINLLFDYKKENEKINLNELINKLLKKYEIIVIDTSSECFFDYNKQLINYSDKCIFLTEANLLELNKSQKLLEMYCNNWNINKEKIHIVFNKFTNKSIDYNLLKNIYNDYDLLGILKFSNEYNCLINNNLKNLIFNSKIIKEYENIIQKIV